jgi:IclR family pca regulon transcriptional regulator
LIYIERIKTQKIVNINLHVGSRLELYNTAMGRVLAAFSGEEWLCSYLKYLKNISSAEQYWREGGKKFKKILKEVRDSDYAINDEELTLGLRSVASPVRNRDYQVVAAVNIAVSSSLYSLQRLKEELIAPLKETTQAISSALGCGV